MELNAFAHLQTWAGSTRMNYARFVIPHLFRSIASRVLYLDADILVLGDLEALWNADLDDAPVGAVLDGGVDPLLKAGGLTDRNIPRVPNYFNAGVLLIDLARWREERISERALEYLTANPTSFFRDQDALNVACDGRWKRLNDRWNFQRHLEYTIAEMPPSDRPAVVHFVSSEKPWDASSLSRNAALYDSYRNRTRFSRNRALRLRDHMETLWTTAKKQFLSRTAIATSVRTVPAVSAATTRQP